MSFQESSPASGHTAILPPTDHLRKSTTPTSLPVSNPAYTPDSTDSHTLAEGQLVERDLNEGNVLSRMGPGRKSLLLAIFSSAMFLDSAGISAIFIMTAPISADLNIQLNQTAWILTSYSLAFSAFLLFAGRLADLYPPHLVFVGGFLGLGAFNLIISFMINRYAFWILRAISGVFAVQTIPSAINMVVQMYPKKEEQAAKLALFGLAGALANVLGLVLAGVFLLGSWRWYFRFVAIISIPFAIMALWLLPKTEAVAEKMPGTDKLKRMDPLGVLLMVAVLALFILGFTSAPVYGWSSAQFLAPFLVSLACLAAFFLWESRLPEGFSLLPKGMWSYPNMVPLVIGALTVFMWFATFQLRIATYFQEVLGNSAILTAAKIVPMGITALFAGAISQAVPTLITRPRWTILGSAILGFVGTVLFVFSYGGHGKKYWSFIFTGEIIGTFGVLFFFIIENTLIIQSFPIAYAGVAGSVAQIIFQLGGVIGVSIQTALDSTGDGTLADWKGTQAGFWFSGACLLVAGTVFSILWKQSAEEEEVPLHRNKQGLDLELMDKELGV